MTRLAAALAGVALGSGGFICSPAAAMPGAAIQNDRPGMIEPVRCARHRCRTPIYYYYSSFPPLYGYTRYQRDYWYPRGPARVWY
jgi:hypothetical protein